MVSCKSSLVVHIDRFLGSRLVEPPRAGAEGSRSSVSSIRSSSSSYGAGKEELPGRSVVIGVKVLSALAAGKEELPGRSVVIGVKVLSALACVYTEHNAVRERFAVC